MNRKQLRKQVKAGIIYTGSQVTEMLELERSRTIKKCGTLYMAIITLALRDKLQFGKKRTTDFLDHVHSIMGAVREDRISIDDILKAIDDECGVKF